MFYCPECMAPFDTEDKVVKHYLACWRERHPNQTPNEVPHTYICMPRHISPDMSQFMEDLKGKYCAGNKS